MIAQCCAGWQEHNPRRDELLVVKGIYIRSTAGADGLVLVLLLLP
jgi:hypothetical protein